MHKIIRTTKMALVTYVLLLLACDIMILYICFYQILIVNTDASIRTLHFTVVAVQGGASSTRPNGHKVNLRQKKRCQFYMVIPDAVLLLPYCFTCGYRVVSWQGAPKGRCHVEQTAR